MVCVVCGVCMCNDSQGGDHQCVLCACVCVCVCNDSQGGDHLCVLVLVCVCVMIVREDIISVSFVLMCV